ncbi:MAG: porin [Bacteroidota bacterium]
MFGSPLQTRGQDEPLFDELMSALKQKHLSVGLLLQVGTDFQIERSFPGNNGFNISNARIDVSGELDGGFGYLLQASLTGSPSILDAKAHYRITQQFIVDAGLFKPPFSKEFLTHPGSIDFVNRSQVVTALVASRQIGVQLRGAISGSPVGYGVGVFNGNGFDGNNNDNNDFMYAGRLGISPLLGDSSLLEVGVNGLYSNDKNAVIGSGVLPSFDGTRLMYGGDVRMMYRDFLLSAEAIVSRLKQRDGRIDEPSGYYVSAGYMLTATSQILLRWDSFSPDGFGSDSRLLIFGYNLWPTRPTEVQVNYVIPTREAGPKHHQLLLNAQIMF